MQEFYVEQIIIQKHYFIYIWSSMYKFMKIKRRQTFIFKTKPDVAWCSLRTLRKSAPPAGGSWRNPSHQTDPRLTLFRVGFTIRNCCRERRFPELISAGKRVLSHWKDGKFAGMAVLGSAGRWVQCKWLCGFVSRTLTVHKNGKCVWEFPCETLSCCSVSVFNFYICSSGWYWRLTLNVSCWRKAGLKTRKSISCSFLLHRTAPGTPKWCI